MRLACGSVKGRAVEGRGAGAAGIGGDGSVGVAGGGGGGGDGGGEEAETTDLVLLGNGGVDRGWARDQRDAVAHAHATPKEGTQIRVGVPTWEVVVVVVVEGEVWCKRAAGNGGVQTRASVEGNGTVAGREREERHHEGKSRSESERKRYVVCPMWKAV